MGEPDLESFRRWIQLEIAETEAEGEGPDRDKRLVHLEAALQESMAFSVAWQIRLEAEIEPVKATKNVRLVSVAPEVEVETVSTGLCRHCDAPLDAALEFCGSCGGYP
jgi:hypothetical protein